MWKTKQKIDVAFYAQLALGVVVLTTFLPYVILSYNCEFNPGHLEYHNVTNLKQSLQHQILGPVLAPWDDKYEQFRRIHNQACCQKPLLIARPRSQKVSKQDQLSKESRNYICLCIQHSYIINARDANASKNIFIWSSYITFTHIFSNMPYLPYLTYVHEAEVNHL